MTNKYMYYKYWITASLQCTCIYTSEGLIAIFNLYTMYVQIKYLKLKDLQRSKAGLGYSEKFKALISGIDRLVRASLERRVKKHVE